MIFTESYFSIVSLSLYVSLIAMMLSMIISILISSYLVINDFRGKSFILLAFSSMMSLPPVVVGLVLYILFSSSGIIGFMDLLYTPKIMILAQLLIIMPIIITLSYQVLSNLFIIFNQYLSSMQTSNVKVLYTLIVEGRNDLLIIMLTGLGRALSEVGAVIIVGGNIAYNTRVMTTSIVLETSRGNLELALNLGITLLLIAIALNLFIFLLKKDK
jgi:tungstate transport system permease protein